MRLTGVTVSLQFGASLASNRQSSIAGLEDFPPPRRRRLQRSGLAKALRIACRQSLAFLFEWLWLQSKRSIASTHNQIALASPVAQDIPRQAATSGLYLFLFHTSKLHDATLQKGKCMLRNVSVRTALAATMCWPITGAGYPASGQIGPTGIMSIRDLSGYVYCGVIGHACSSAHIELHPEAQPDTLYTADSDSRGWFEITSVSSTVRGGTFLLVVTTDGAPPFSARVRIDPGKRVFTAIMKPRIQE